MRRRILFVLGLVVAIALVVAFRVRFLIDPGYYKELVIARLEQHLGREVRVSSASVTIWPALGLRLHEVAIARTPPVPGSPFVAAEGFHVAVRIMPLLQGHIVVDRIMIDRPAITVTRNADGVLSIADLLTGRKRDAVEQPSNDDALSGASRAALGSRITVDRGDLTFVDDAAPGGPLTGRVRDLTVDIQPRAGLGPRFSLQAGVGPEDGNGTIAMRGTVGQIPEPWHLADLPGDLRLELQRIDLRRLVGYLPAQWRGRLPGAVVTTDLAISGSAADELAVRGTLRLEQAELSHPPVRVTGTIAAEIDGTHAEGVIQGTARIRLAPGTFRKQDDIVIDGHTDIDATIRFGNGPFAVQARVDATRADLRIKDVFEKHAGTGLVLAADVAPTDSGIAVRNARGHLDLIAVTGHADIGRAPGPGRSTPFGLHFGATDIDLASAPELVAATAPFAIAGRGRVERLDILRRPEEKWQWQVTLDASLSEVHARLPVGDGRAHVVDALSAELHIEPGWLRVSDATTHVNGVPLALDGTANDFMALLSGDRDQPRAEIEVAVRGDTIDLGELLTPAEVPSGAARDGVSGTAAEDDTPPGVDPSRPFPQRVTIRTGTLDAPEATYLGQPLSDLHVTIGYVPSTLRIEAARFGLHGGHAEVKGSVAFDDGPAFALDVSIQDVRLREALAAFSPAQPLEAQGVVDGSLSFRTRGASVAAWRKTAAGAGTVTLRDGVLPRFNLIDVLAREMLGIFSFVPGTRRISLGGSNPFSKLEQVFQLSSEGLTADTVTLITDDYRLSGVGAITFDGELDYDAKVKLTAKGTQRILTVVALPIPGSSHVTLPAIPVRVTGSLSKPKILPDVSALPVAPLRAIGDAGEKGVRAVGKGVRRLFGGEHGTTDDSPAAGDVKDTPAADAAQDAP